MVNIRRIDMDCKCFAKDKSEAKRKLIQMGFEYKQPVEKTTDVGKSGSGDLNQGIGNNIAVVRVDGDAEGNGLPTLIVIKNRTTGEVLRYTPQSL